MQRFPKGNGISICTFREASLFRWELFGDFITFLINESLLESIICIILISCSMMSAQEIEKVLINQIEVVNK